VGGVDDQERRLQEQRGRFGLGGGSHRGHEHEPDGSRRLVSAAAAQARGVVAAAEQLGQRRPGVRSGKGCGLLRWRRLGNGRLAAGGGGSGLEGGLDGAYSDLVPLWSYRPVQL
jgi:hypothetical protein